ncbi:glycosyltransferase family 1 protein [Halobacteriales archaeon QS_3_64_16]|nr:MAG: glycosyltransferase family 1 protein [Halobacteriales archaeon QS_3_64_16]
MGPLTGARRLANCRSFLQVATDIVRRLRSVSGTGTERRAETEDGDCDRGEEEIESEFDRDGRPAERRQLRVLLVGPVQATGGIARYIGELRGRLPESVAVAVYDTAAPPGSGPIRFARGALGALLDALRFLFHDRPDVLHVHTAENYSFLRKSVYVLLGRYVWGKPVILHVHGPTFDRFVAEAAAPLRVLQRVVFAASARIVVLSPYWEEALSARLPAGKTVVLPNAIDTGEYEPRFDAEPPHIVFVANHVPRKGIREFADAIVRVLDTGADCRVSIAGSGPLEGYAAELAERYPEVEYLGFVSEEEKRELLCTASIYVLPAYAEGLPIGVLEGMAGGNAIVGTAVGGVPDLIDENGGRLIAPRDPEALADALEALVTAPEEGRQMGHHNAEAVEQYTWERVIPQLTDLYATVAEESWPERP